MLTAILSPLIGMLGGFLPAIVKYFERKQEIQHEIELTKIKLDAAKQEAQIQLVVKNVEADIEDAKSVRLHDSAIDGGRFLNSLRASIRPVITYSFFILFVIVKLSAAYVMLSTGQSVPEMLHAVWDVDTSALFGTIMAFWFGARVMEKMNYGGMADNSLERTILVSSNKPATTKKK
jgi:tetrahydromethanopterin S-methyltransferase subunit E